MHSLYTITSWPWVRAPQNLLAMRCSQTTLPFQPNPDAPDTIHASQAVRRQNSPSHGQKHKQLSCRLFFLRLKFLQLNLWTAFFKSVLFHHGGRLQAPFRTLVRVQHLSRLLERSSIFTWSQASSVGRCSFQETLPWQFKASSLIRLRLFGTPFGAAGVGRCCGSTRLVSCDQVVSGAGAKSQPGVCQRRWQQPILQHGRWTTLRQRAEASPSLILWQMVDITAKNCGKPEAPLFAIEPNVGDSKWKHFWLRVGSGSCFPVFWHCGLTR